VTTAVPSAPAPAALARRAAPYLAILGTVLFWGLSFVASKTILNSGVPPMTMVAMRFAVASVILFPILKIREPGRKLGARGILALTAGGLLGVTVYFFFESRGVKLTTASNASLIIGTIPVFTVVAERLFYKSAIAWYRWIGVALSLVGVYLLVGRTGAGEAAGGPAGDLFMLGACLSWVAYNMVSRNLHKRFSDFAITTYQALFGTIFLLPLALLEHRSWVPLSTVALLDILYLAVFCSAGAYFLYVFALARIGPIGIAPFINLIPVVGALGGVLILGERLAAAQIAGGGVVIVGVLVVNLRRRA
jgi:drug/metabolite transporter (DMT)-like permease